MPADRHSRVSGNPDGTEKTSPLPPNCRRIPAYAGMTVGGWRESGKAADAGFPWRGNPGKQELPQRIRQKPALSRRLSAFV